MSGNKTGWRERSFFFGAGDRVESARDCEGLGGALQGKQVPPSQRSGVACFHEQGLP
jgi:hypothetical protein